MSESHRPVTAVTALARELLDQAREHPAHRASRSVVGGKQRRLRQTVIALAAGAQLAEHEAPGEATLLVLSGQVAVTAGGSATSLSAGDLLEIPQARHTLDAAEDSAVLLTTLPREFEQE